MDLLIIFPIFFGIGGLVIELIEPIVDSILEWMERRSHV